MGCNNNNTLSLHLEGREEVGNDCARLRHHARAFSPGRVSDRVGVPQSHFCGRLCGCRTKANNMNILTLAREEDETSAQAGLAEKDPATGSAGESNAHISGSGSAKTAAQMQGARRLADMVKGSVEGPIPNQTLSQFLNRAHVHAIVKRCVMDKETKVGWMTQMKTGAKSQFGILLPYFTSFPGALSLHIVLPNLESQGSTVGWIGTSNRQCYSTITLGSPIGSESAPGKLGK